MFKPAAMQKIMLLSTRKAESRLISALHKQGAMEISEFEVPGLEKGKPLKVHDDISRELVRVRGLLSVFQSLPVPKNAAQAPAAVAADADYTGALSEAARITIDNELRQFADLRGQLVSEGAEIAKRKGIVSRLEGFGSMDFSKLETRDFTFTAGMISKASVPQLQKELTDYFGGNSELVRAPAGKDQEMIIAFYGRGKDIAQVLAKYDFEKIELPAGLTTVRKGIESLEAAATENRKRMAEADTKLAELGGKYVPALLALEKKLSVLSARAAIATRFAGSSKMVAIEGWIRKKDLIKIEKMVKGEFSGEAELVPLGSDMHDAPIVLDNPKAIGQFQWLVEFYSLPTYTEFDPTFLLLFFVPIMYGMIVGDVGYAAISVVLSLLIMKKFKGGLLGNISKIWLFSSVSAAAFGVVFDEWFGFSHLELAQWLKEWGLNLGIEHPLYAGLSRSHDLSLVIGLALLVGVAQLSLGFILGAINAWGHDKKHAFLKIVWLALLLSGTIAVCSLMFNLLPADIGTIGEGIFAVCTLIIIVMEGLPGLFEIPGLTANVLSYARIGAAGVVGVIIAEIVNESLLPLPGKSLIMIPIFIVLHILNAALAMFESIVQGGRLNLVEFYGKFFQGGGRAFQPFRMEEQENK